MTREERAHVHACLQPSKKMKIERELASVGSLMPRNALKGMACVHLSTGHQIAWLIISGLAYIRRIADWSVQSLGRTPIQDPNKAFLTIMTDLFVFKTNTTKVTFSCVKSATDFEYFMRCLNRATTGEVSPTSHNGVLMVKD